MKVTHRILLLAFLFFILGVCTFSLMSASVESSSGWQIDLFSQNGGWGKDVASSPFVVGSLIKLYGYVTYNKVPVQGVLVSFQVDKPNGSVLLISARQTNASGYAATNFTISQNAYRTFPSEWNSTATTSPTQDTVSDSMPFEVLPLYVGGISLPIASSASYICVMTVLIEILIGSVLIVFARFRKKQNEPLHTS